MENIYNLFKFIEDKYPHYKIPIGYKILNGDSLTKEELHIKGSLLLDNHISLTALPEGLTIDGSLNLNRCTNLKLLPKDLTIIFDFDFRFGQIIKLPNDLKVGGTIDLRDCSNLESLPDNLKVGGSLYLNRCTSLKSLPKNLICHYNEYKPLLLYNRYVFCLIFVSSEVFLKQKNCINFK